MTYFSKWDRDAYRRRVGEEEAARRRGAIMAEQGGYQLAERKRLGFTQTELAFMDMVADTERLGLYDADPAEVKAALKAARQKAKD